MMNRLVLIGIQEENLSYMHKQLLYIFNELVDIRVISLKELHSASIHPTDTVLLSGAAIQELVRPFVPASCMCIIAERMINIVNLKEILALDDNRNILVINDNDDDTLQTVESMRQIVPQHQYFPFLTDKKIPEDIHLVVTPGEQKLVPQGFPIVMDIGPRVISIDTLLAISRKFELAINDSLLMQLYIKALVYLSERQPEIRNGVMDDQNFGRTFEELDTHSATVNLMKELARRMAKTNHYIHIDGEVGTGKQMWAEMIHNESIFSAFPIFTYNCSHKEPESIRRELFEEGLEQIERGTLFIKNIDQLPYSLQGRLAGLFENQTPDLRIITSTATNLSELVKREQIRMDVYSYISTYRVQIPPLRERKEDIPILINNFKTHLKQESLVFSSDVIDAFTNYDWPGNVRELYNVVSYCACLNNNVVDIESLPLFFKGNQYQAAASDLDVDYIIGQIENHGFLDDSIELLRIFKEGKEQQKSFGRRTLKEMLAEKDTSLTDQQLRLRMEVLNRLGLLIVRKGRAGSTISQKGEEFLELYGDL
ncbi:hypothetical protein SporoP37_12210 [Sporosarcina sp. P37]|uniref:sigma 54-interacting transcriptional regulator n=1 Tax=unclassified Sporosarcina TaxID=2647733 RepID=UPI000A179A81|nr:MULTISPECIES: sigma 54-interacting transcriptional regulator [unclassified Sporosarcina]ARK25343.1 hypothetical protein SporoP37_12210 [Sporosarcina sp. P37]PID17140.1 hypothetical protein CSV62_15050 [Sporosarcina sp. P35]